MTGILIGIPLPFRNLYSRATSKVLEVCGSPSSIRHTLAVVPPMSYESTRDNPNCFAIKLLNIAPPAGPDSTRRTGNRMAVSSVVMPPPDNIKNRGQSRPCVRNWEASDRRCLLMSGCTYAFAQAVEIRSNSLISGETSDESVTSSSGASAQMISRARCS